MPKAPMKIELTEEQMRELASIALRANAWSIMGRAVDALERAGVADRHPGRGVAPDGEALGILQAGRGWLAARLRQRWRTHRGRQNQTHAAGDVMIGMILGSESVYWVEPHTTRGAYNGSVHRIAEADIVISVKADGTGSVLKDRYNPCTPYFISRPMVNLLKWVARVAEPQKGRSHDKRC